MTAVTDRPAASADENAFAAEIVALRRDMLRFAKLQLRSAEAAEDMVQDAIAAALRGARSFAGRSSLKTWVFAILRNRIVDHIRQEAKVIPLSTLEQEEVEWEDRVDALFDANGAWSEAARPAAWPRPEERLQQQQFWRVFEARLEHLPANTARVFMMREFLGFDAQEICDRLGITSGNFHVIVHRARLRLRDCGCATAWNSTGVVREACHAELQGSHRTVLAIAG